MLITGTGSADSVLFVSYGKMHLSTKYTKIHQENQVVMSESATAIPVMIHYLVTALFFVKLRALRGSNRHFQVQMKEEALCRNSPRLS